MKRDEAISVAVGARDTPSTGARPGSSGRSTPSKDIHAWQRPTGSRWVYFAVIAVVLLGVWGVVEWISRRPKAAPPATPQEYMTPRGQRTAVTLKDGSEVTLNVASRLVVPDNFAQRSRRVFLEGEGYFKVVRNAKLRLIVQTPLGYARALGTKFIVRAYAGDPRREMQVVVVDGTVEVSPTSWVDTLTLHAGEAGHVTEYGQLESEQGVYMRARVGWTEGRLEFDNLALGEAVPMLSRWFDVDVRVQDRELANYPVTGSFSNQPFAEVAQAIARIVEARVVRRGDVTYFVRR